MATLVNAAPSATSAPMRTAISGSATGFTQPDKSASAPEARTLASIM